MTDSRNERTTAIMKHRFDGLIRTFGSASGACLILLAMAAVPAHAETSELRLNTLVEVDVTAVSAQELLDMGADVWGVRDEVWHVRVSQAMLNKLSDRGVSFQVIHEDLQRAYEAYRQRWPLRRHGMPHPRSESFADYHDLRSAEDILRRIAQTHSDIAVLEVIGYSVESRPIYALRISDEALIIDDEEPAVLIIGCHHAREWISVEVPLFLADYLTDNYRKDGTVTRLINYTEIWIIPVLNPDGYLYSWTTDRWWRKNRRDNGDGTFGVDPNRNYPSANFGGSGTSMDPSSEVYPGTEAFSEPETQAIRELIEGEDGRDFVAAVSYHNYSQLVMYPFGYTSEPTADAETFESLAMEMTRLINLSHEDPAHDYRYGQTSHILYQASGDFTDWAYTDHGVLGITIEVRPAGPPYFELPPNEVRPTCEENLPAFLHLAEETAIPELKASDADLDGFADVDDYCPNSPSADVDTMGCDESEEDVDEDGIPNEEDACGDSLPGQLVGLDGCRVEALFSLTITSNAESVEVAVDPEDIDAKGDGLAGPSGLTRDYASETDIVVSAAQESDGAVFRYWIADGDHLPAGERTISMTTSRDVRLEAIYAVPVRLDIVGDHRIPDKSDTGMSYIGRYQAVIVYSDGSTNPVGADDVAWYLADESVGVAARGGELLAYDVPPDVGEVTTSLHATTELSSGSLSSPAFQVAIYDAETRSPHCEQVIVSGPGRVYSDTSAAFRAQVMFEGSQINWTGAEQPLWLIEGGEDEATEAPAFISGEGVLTVEPISEDMEVVVMAAYPNDNGTVCTGEMVVTLAAADADEVSEDGADRTAPFMCGAFPAATLLSMFIGLMSLRVFKR